MKLGSARCDRGRRAPPYHGAAALHQGGHPIGLATDGRGWSLAATLTAEHTTGWSCAAAAWVSWCREHRSDSSTESTIGRARRTHRQFRRRSRSIVWPACHHVAARERLSATSRSRVSPPSSRGHRQHAAASTCRVRRMDAIEADPGHQRCAVTIRARQTCLGWATLRSPTTSCASRRRGSRQGIR